MYRYDVSRIFRLKRTLAENLGEFAGTTPRAAQFERFVRIVYEALPGNIDWQTLEDSLRHVAGTLVTPELLADVSWRMAGNVHRLRDRRAVPPWHVQKLPEWVPLQVLSARHARNARGRIGCQYSFRVLAGTPCPRIMTRWWSLEQCRWFAWSGFGYSRPKSLNARTPPKYPFGHPAQLVTMRLYGLVDPDLCAQEPQFKELAWPPCVAAHNKKQVRRRFRIDPGYPCPRGLPISLPCHQCTTGYLKCPAGTHRQDWVLADCPDCGENAYFDPDIPTNKCIDCYVKSAYKVDP